MKPTIKDVAKLAGVSFKTVSRVINREPSVGEELQARVWDAVKQLDYQPNLSARQLRGAASFIAFIYDNPNSHYVIEMQHGMLAECQRQGYELLIHPLAADDGNFIDDLVQLAGNGHVTGLILTPPFSESAALVKALRARDINFVGVLSGSSVPDSLGPGVYVDDFKAARECTNYLVGLGHRTIGFLGGDIEHRSSIERLRGYRQALKDNHIAADERLIIPGEFNFDSGADRARQLLAGQPRPTAIFASNDEIAAGALFAARIEQVAVPQELSIVGFEDSPFSRQTWPKLTTAHQPTRDIAMRAARLLIDNIRAARQGTEPEAAEDTGFEPQLVIRDSTCPAPA